MLVLIPLMAVLTALEGRLPDGHDTALGPLMGAATGRPTGPRVGALVGGLLGDQLDKQHAAKAERDVVAVGSKTTVWARVSGKLVVDAVTRELSDEHLAEFARIDPKLIRANAAATNPGPGPAPSLPPGRPTVGAGLGTLAGNDIDRRHANGADPDAAYAAELLDILNTTKPPQTFVVTLGLLGEAKIDPRRVVPIAIRGAERLGIFGKRDAVDSDDTTDGTARRVTGMIVDLARQSRPSGKETSAASPAKPAQAESKRPVRTIYVPLFRSEAKAKGSSRLATDLTEDTIRAIGTRTPYKVVADPKNADTELLVTIAAVELTTRGPDPKAGIRERETLVVVHAEVLWRDLRTGEILAAEGRVGDKPAAVRIRTGTTGAGAMTAADGVFDPEVFERLTEQVVSLLEKPLERSPSRRDKLIGRPGEIVPVQPWQAERLDEKYKAADPGRVPILPPVRAGFPNPINCCDEPTDREVLAAFPAAAKGIPAVYTETRDNFRITKELESEKLDAQRFYPLVGVARAHHGTWKCTVRFTETVASDYPFPVTVSRDRTEVIRVRTTHLHFTEPQKGPATRDLTTDPSPRP